MKAKLIKKQDGKPVEKPVPKKQDAAKPAGPAVDPRIVFRNLFKP